MAKKDCQNPVRILTSQPSAYIRKQKKDTALKELPSRANLARFDLLSADYILIYLMVAKVASTGKNLFVRRATKMRCFVKAVSASKVQTLSTMPGVIMTCMSDLRPGFVGSIATAGVGTYVGICSLRLPMRIPRHR